MENGEKVVAPPIHGYARTVLLPTVDEQLRPTDTAMRRKVRMPSVEKVGYRTPETHVIRLLRQMLIEEGHDPASGVGG